MMFLIPQLLHIAFSLALASFPQTPSENPVARPSPVAPEADRQAILAMRGEYQVGFHFEETVVLAPGYQRKPGKDVGGYEAVVLVEDTGNRIVLQHLLVVGGEAVKHWRQDWLYEAPNRFEFVADQTWRVRSLSAEETRGKWTQCVFDVNDGPRYCGTGAWNHGYGNSTWTSDRTWRPLPRRESTTRDDYNAINAENRHTITPTGWTHEQDNTKTVREGKRPVGALVREFGFNDYRRIEGHDFQPAYDYWRKTGAFWDDVRRRWREILTREGLTLNTAAGAMPLDQRIAALAAGAERGDTVTETEVDAVFSRYLESLRP